MQGRRSGDPEFGRGGTPGSVRVLLVEDNDNARRLIAEVLRAAGYEGLYIAPSAEEALAVLPVVEPDLIVCDWNLPGMSGVELVRQVRTAEVRLDTSIPNVEVAVVMLTGRRTKSAVDAARDAGVDEFVIKPFSTASLIERVEAAFRRRRPFVRSQQYLGPDRRRRGSRAYSGLLKRACDVMAAAPEPLLIAEQRAQLIREASASLSGYLAAAGLAPDTEVVCAHSDAIASLMRLAPEDLATGEAVIAHLGALVRKRAPMWLEAS